MPNVRVLVVDAHPLARLAISRILAETGWITVTASCAQPAGNPECDVVVLDPRLASGVVALDMIRTLSTHVPVLVVSDSRDPGDVTSAIRTGAAGYVNKQATEGTYPEAVDAARQGRMYVFVPSAPTSSGDRLSPRERETLSYIARGYTHSQTATRMRVSKTTVDTYIARVRDKLSLGNKAELALAAANHAAEAGYSSR
jgi:two-component system, NarL family, nitrate/nitrite response regulator NarL